MHNVLVISSTVRPGRKGPIIGQWMADRANEHELLSAELVDLGTLQLPVMNEPNHPRLGRYVHEHTKEWSARIEKADAFVFVTAEYNHTYPASLQNALEYLSREWAYKAAGIVSYGGVSAGTRAYKDLKTDLLAYKMVPLVEAVNIPLFTQLLNEEDQFVPNETIINATDGMIRELVRWVPGLKVVKEHKQLEEQS